LYVDDPLSTEEYPLVTGNLIAGNTVIKDGGAVYCYQDSIVMTCNTIVGNTAGLKGGGLMINDSANPIVTNCIFWGNNAPAGKEIYLGDFGIPSTLTISYSNVKGGQSQVFVEPNAKLYWGGGMIDADPLFVDAANGDYHLTCISPCYGAGDDNTPGLPSKDFEGDPRVIHDNVEIGADEFFCHLYCVGNLVPGNVLGVRVAAIPGQEVTLYRGNDVLETPYWTGHGYMYITWPAAGSWYLRRIPNTGVLKLDVTVPLNWNPGESYPFQAQVGQWGNTSSWLTNLLELTVE
jgi:hypothetical protein